MMNAAATASRTVAAGNPRAPGPAARPAAVPTPPAVPPAAPPVAPSATTGAASQQPRARLYSKVSPPICSRGAAGNQPEPPREAAKAHPGAPEAKAPSAHAPAGTFYHCLSRLFVCISVCLSVCCVCLYAKFSCFHVFYFCQPVINCTGTTALEQAQIARVTAASRESSSALYLQVNSAVRWVQLDHGPVAHRGTVKGAQYAMQY